MPISLRFAFQGGGAKFVTLLAAAKALYDLRKKHIIDIDHVSGTSAGAIVAGLLASGTDPGIVRTHLKTTGTKHLHSVIRSRWATVNAWRVFINGLPLYDYADLLQFVRTLIEAGGNRPNMGLTQCDCGVSIVASDLSRRKPHLYRHVPGVHVPVEGEVNRQDVELAVAIANSCSLPLIFKNTRGVFDNHLVDGGIIENLPVRCLLDGFEASRVVGFSFKALPAQPNIKTIKDYALCLIDTSISANIDASYRLIPASNIISLPYSYSTMDFAKALDSGLVDHFDSVYQTVEREVSAIADRESDLEERAEGTRLSRAINERSSAGALFNILDREFPVESFIFEATFDSLRNMSRQQRNDLDTYVKTYTLSFEAPQRYVPFRVFLNSSEEKMNSTLSNIDVYDENHDRLEFIPLIGSSQKILEDDIFSIPIYLFIDTKDFQPGLHKITIKHTDRIEKSLLKIHRAEPGAKVTEVLGGLASARRGSVEWKAHFPISSLKYIEVQELDALDTAARCDGFAKGDRNDDFPGAPIGFRTIRWKSSDPVEAFWATGFQFVYAAPSG